MRCPKCGARFPRGSHICFKCGTKAKQIQEASFKAVKQAKKDYEYDKIVLSTTFPKDLNYKTTLLLTIFTGFFGGHMYYVRRPIWGIVYSICFLFMLTFIIMSGLNTGFDASRPIHFDSEILNILFVLSCIFGALMLYFWIADIFKVATKRFKVPVVLKEK